MRLQPDTEHPHGMSDAEFDSMSSSAGHVRQLRANKRLACRSYTRTHGEDAPEIRDWTWAS